MKPFLSELMMMWPIDRKVGSPKNDSPDIIEEIDPDTDLRLPSGVRQLF